MKMAVATGGDIPSRRAHSIAVMKMANGFHKLGHDVKVLTVERFSENKMKKKMKDVHDLYGVDHAIQIVYFRDYFYYFENFTPFDHVFRLLDKVMSRKLRYIADPERRISDYCREHEFDLCYYRGYGRVAYYNVVKNRVPTIMESHIRNTNNPDLRRAVKVSHSEYFKGLVTISEVLKREFVKAGVPEEKILVLSSGVDLEAFQHLPDTKDAREMLNLPLDKKIIVYTGSLFPEKGIKQILLVAERLPEALFLLVGGEPKYIRFWKNYADSHGIRNVRFTGFVSNKMIPIYLVAADVLLMPYEKRPARIMDIESTSPLKLFEYMASKKPIVSTNIPAISRYVTHGVDGLLAEPGNINQLTDYVRLVMEDIGLARKLSENAYEKVKALDWRERCRKILKRFCS